MAYASTRTLKQNQHEATMTNNSLINNPWLVQIIGGIVSGLVVGLLLAWIAATSKVTNPKDRRIVRLIKASSYVFIIPLSIISFIWSIPFFVMAFIFAAYFYGITTWLKWRCKYTPACRDYLTGLWQIFDQKQPKSG
jgi:fructose-specific phosphotransferase system IIC component